MPAIFDGTDDYITYAYSSGGAFSLGTAGAAKTTLQPFSWAGWVRNQTVTSGDYRVLFADNTSGNTHFLAITYQAGLGSPYIRVLIRGSTQSYTAYFTAPRSRGNKERIVVTISPPANTTDGTNPTVTVYANGVALSIPNVEGNLNGTLIGGGGGWTIGGCSSYTAPATAPWIGEVEGVRVWNSVLSAAEVAADYVGNSPTGSVYFPLATNSTGYKTDGTTTFSGTESGGGITYRSAGLTGEGISAEWKAANLTGSVGSDATSWAETLTNALLDTGTANGKCEVDAYLAKHIAPDQRTLKSVSLRTASTTAAGNAVWGNSATIYIACAPRAYVQSYGDTSKKVIFTLGAGHIRIQMTYQGFLEVYSGAGATATVTSALRIPCSPCVIAVRLSKTSPVTGAPTGIKFWINQDRSEDATGSQLTVGTSASSTPSTFVNMCASEGDSLKFSGDIWHVAISARPDDDATVVARIAAIGTAVGIRTTPPSKLIATAHDSHVNGQWQTLNYNIFKQLWPRYPEAEFYNFSIPGSTVADAFGQVTGYVDEADVLARAPKGSRLYFMLVGANELGDDPVSPDGIIDSPPLDNSSAINTGAGLITNHLNSVTYGFSIVEIEPYVRGTFSATDNVTRETYRQSLWTKRQLDTKVSRRVSLPTVLRSWSNGSTPTNATITATTGNTTYYEGTIDTNLHLKKAGVTALMNGNSGTGADGILGAVDALLGNRTSYRISRLARPSRLNR